MSHDARAVANYLLDRAAERKVRLTPMHILKLVYIAHGWNLALYDKPLIKEDVEAWDHGPVIPDLYHSIKKFGSGRVTGPVTVFDFEADSLERKIEEEFTADERALMDRVLEVYGHLPAFQLSALTHRESTPWYQMRHDLDQGIGWGNSIPDEIIKNHFKILAGQNEQRQE